MQRISTTTESYPNAPSLRNESIQSHSLRGHFLDSLPSFIGRFGIDFGDLSKEQLSMFIAAYNLLGDVQALALPLAQEQSNGDAQRVLSEEVEELANRQATESQQTSGQMAEEYETRPIRGPEELPHILPSEWLSEELAPELFLLKAARGELLMRTWVEPEETVVENEFTSYEKRVEENKSGRDERNTFSAYALLDVSKSMDGRDNRGTVARGLTLAFLHTAYTRGDTFYYRPFNDSLGEESQGSDFHQLRATAQRVISEENSGMTAIQAALEKAVQDADTPYILLVTDGYSRLTENPLNESKLFTYVLGDVESQVSPHAVPLATEQLRTLKDWSTTFTRIDEERFKQLYTVHPSQVMDLSSDIESIPTKLDEAISEQQVAKLENELQNYEFLLDSIDHSNNTLCEELQELKESVRKLLEHIQRTGKEKIATTNRSQMSPESVKQLEMIEELEARAEQQSASDDPSSQDGSAKGKSKNGKTTLVPANPLETLKRLVQTIQKAFRALTPRRPRS